MFCLVKELGHDVYNIVMCTDVVQFDDALVVVIMHHVVYGIYMFGSLVCDQVVGHEYEPLVIRVDIHWKGNMYKLIHTLVEPDTDFACVRNYIVFSLGRRTHTKWFVITPSHNVTKHEQNITRLRSFYI